MKAVGIDRAHAVHILLDLVVQETILVLLVIDSLLELVSEAVQLLVEVFGLGKDFVSELIDLVVPFLGEFCFLSSDARAKI